MRKAVFSDVEDALFLWLKEARSKGAPVSGPLLKVKANKLAQDMGLEFSCTDGWLNRFKKRKDVSFRVISGEANAGLKSQSAIGWMRSCLVCCCVTMQRIFSMLMRRAYFLKCCLIGPIRSRVMPAVEENTARKGSRWWWLPTWMVQRNCHCWSLERQRIRGALVSTDFRWPTAPTRRLGWLAYCLKNGCLVWRRSSGRKKEKCWWSWTTAVRKAISLPNCSQLNWSCCHPTAQANYNLVTWASFKTSRFTTGK